MPRPRRVAIFNDTRRTAHYGCEFVMQVLFAELRARAIEPVFCWPMGHDWRGRPEVDAALRTVDAVIVNGEGSIHDSARRERARYLAEVARHARRHAGIPSFLVNASLYRLEPDVIDALREFRGIWLRESRSFDTLAGSGIDAARVPDLTLLTAAPPPTARHGVIGTDSVRAEVAQRLHALCRQRGWRHTRLTHAARPRPGQYDGRLETLRRHAKWLHARLTGRNTRDRGQFVAELAGSELLCSGRFHAVTLALATRTPLIAVESNTPKISALLADVFGHSRRVLPLAAVEALDERATVDWAWRADETAALEAFLADTRHRAAAMFDRIRRELDLHA